MNEKNPKYAYEVVSSDRDPVTLRSRLTFVGPLQGTFRQSVLLEDKIVQVINDECVNAYDKNRLIFTHEKL